MTNVTIESVTYEQLPECLDVIHTAFEVNCTKYGYTRENYPSCAAFLTLEDLVTAKNIGTHFYAVSVDGKIAGCVQLKRTDADSYAFTRFAVLPEYQHYGFGRKLIEHCSAKAKEYGASKMTLLMMYSNEKLRSFYESCGFTLTKIDTDSEHPFEYAIYEKLI